MYECTNVRMLSHILTRPLNDKNFDPKLSVPNFQLHQNPFGERLYGPLGVSKPILSPVRHTCSNQKVKNSNFGYFDVLFFWRFFVHQRSYRVENLRARRSRAPRYFVRMHGVVEGGCLGGKRLFEVPKGYTYLRRWCTYVLPFKGRIGIYCNTDPILQLNSTALHNYWFDLHP